MLCLLAWVHGQSGFSRFFRPCRYRKETVFLQRIFRFVLSVWNLHMNLHESSMNLQWLLNESSLVVACCPLNTEYFLRSSAITCKWFFSGCRPTWEYARCRINMHIVLFSSLQKCGQIRCGNMIHSGFPCYSLGGNFLRLIILDEGDTGVPFAFSILFCFRWDSFV